MKKIHISIDKRQFLFYNTVVFENSEAAFNPAGEEVTSIPHKYTLIENPASGRAVVYGIKIETSENSSVCFPYISRSRAEAELLIHQMDSSDVSSEHIRDIVRDYITRLYYEKLRVNGLS